jgi:hypothetical protein
MTATLDTPNELALYLVLSTIYTAPAHGEAQMTTRHRLSTPEVVQLEIDADKLESLFASGALCVADMRCLNATSKASIWKMCLNSCASRARCNSEGWGMCRKCVTQVGKTPETSRNWRRATAQGPDRSPENGVWNSAAS